MFISKFLNSNVGCIAYKITFLSSANIAMFYMFFLNWFKMFKLGSVLTIFPTNSKPFFILLYNLPLIICTVIEKTYDHTVTNAHRLAY